MSTTPKQDAQIQEADQHQLELWLIEFDRSWHVDRLAEQLQQLPAEGSGVRSRLLLEMVKIDMEHQWWCGRQVTVESYLKAYPELGTVETVSAELIQAEYEVRLQFGAPADLAEFDERFPEQAADLRNVLRKTREVISDSELVQPSRDTVSFHLEPTPSTATPSPRLPPLPEVFGRYRILRRLGRGGMGEVYLAHDTKLDRDVALKVPQFQADDGPDVLERFKREARSAAMLLHPNICPIHDVGEIGGTHYLTMAYVEGCSLADLARRDPPIPERQIANLIHKLALTLQEAHARGVVHRDLKPTNIMINQRGEPIVMDFGLAWLTNGSRLGDERLTQNGMALGTPAYMSPEQVKGELEAVGAGCDIYSLGVIMYEMLTGKLPFKGPVTSVLANILTQEPERPSSIRRDIHPELEGICLKAMAKSPESRYASMTELADAVAEYLDSARHVEQRGRPPRWPWVATASTIAALVLGAIFYIATDFGTIKIEIEVGDPAAQVQIKVDGNTVDLTGIDAPLRIRAGEHGLEITGKDFQTITKVFRVRRGVNEPLSIELIPRQSGPVIAGTKPATPAPGAAASRVVRRSPEEIAARRQQYLDEHLKPLLNGKKEEVPPTIHAAAFPPHVKTQFQLSMDGLTFKLFSDWQCSLQIDPDRAKTVAVDYFKAFVDAESRPRQVECYGKDGVLREGPAGCAIARYWYDANGNCVQEAYFGIDSKPAENAELVIASRHAFAADGHKVETRYYDQHGQPAEDRVGVHRKVYRDGQVPLEFRLDGSHRERWLPALNLGKRINVKSAWHPAVTPDGKELYFAVGFNGETSVCREQIFRAVWQSGNWSDPEPVIVDGQPLLGLRPCISGDGQLMVLGAWKSDPNRAHREYPDLPNYGQADLYFVERRGENWHAVRNAGPKINRFNEEGGASFIPGTHTLCFGRVRTESDRDLWIADREGELWGEPRPLNVKQASYPVMSSDGRRLYFSSLRKGTFGRSDLWMCEKQGDGWSRAINLGSDVNHADHDGTFTFSSDGQVMYFDRCCPWELWVTGRADSEAAIRHLADIHALGQSE